MCNDCTRMEEDRIKRNIEAWDELFLFVSKATRIYIKVFGSHVLISPQYHGDLLSCIDKQNLPECPDNDYSMGVLYINNVL